MIAGALKHIQCRCAGDSHGTFSPGRGAAHQFAPSVMPRINEAAADNSIPSRARPILESRFPHERPSFAALHGSLFTPGLLRWPVSEKPYDVFRAHRQFDHEARESRPQTALVDRQTMPRRRISPPKRFRGNQNESPYPGACGRCDGQLESQRCSGPPLFQLLSPQGK